MIPVCSDILRRFRAALERDLPQRTLAPSIARTYRHVLCIESIRPPGQAGWAHHDARARPEAHDVIARGRWRAQGQLVGCSLQPRHVSAISGPKIAKDDVGPVADPAQLSERSWQKHQLAWWTVAAYGSVYYLVAGGSKKETKTEAKH